MDLRSDSKDKETVRNADTLEASETIEETSLY